MVNPFRRKQKLEQEWDGIRVSQSSLAMQTESRVWTLLWKALLVFFLVGGGMGSLLSALEVDYHPLIVELVTLIVCLFLASLYYRKAWENGGYLLFFVFMAMVGFGAQSYINSGFYNVMNDLMEAASDFFESNAMRSYGERIGNTTLAVTVSMCYIGAVVCLIVNILISRRMNYFLVLFAVVVTLIFPLYLQLEPEPLFVIQLFTGLFLAAGVSRSGHYSIEKTDSKYVQKKHTIRYVYAKRAVLQAGACALGIVLFVSVLLSVLAPVEDYHKRHPDNAWKKSTMDTVENLSVLGIAGLFNFYSNTGGLTSGRLGGVSAVRLDYETDLTMTFVPYNEERFYLRQFVGQEYEYRANRWKGAENYYLITEFFARLAYDKGEKSSGRGIAKVENVAAESGVYLPYYSLDREKMLYTGRSQEYEYYISGNHFAGQEVSPEYIGDWIDVPDESIRVLDAFCKEADLSGEPEEIVQKLAAYYQKEIPYTYQPGVTPYGQDFVDYFLEKNRRGYCAHFASAATLLFRYMGIPARYVEGYAIDPEDIGEEGEILHDAKVEDYYDGYMELEETGVVKVNITDANAHAWVEIYQDGKGWQVVDITPASAEESSSSMWNMLLRLFRGRNSGSAEGAATADNDVTADAVETMKRTGRISFGVIALIFLLVVLSFAVRMLYRFAGNQWRYYRAGTNDRAILQYQRYVRKVERKNRAFRRERNYEEQIAWLRKNQKVTLDARERDRLLRILEQAGFSSRELSVDDADWLHSILHRKNN